MLFRYYSIEAVFTTKKKAKEYVQQNGTDYNIEEYELDEEVTKQVQLWRVEFNIDTKKLSNAGICVGYNADEYRDTCRVIHYSHSGNLIWFFVDADSMDKAIKIASERFAAIGRDLQHLTTQIGSVFHDLKGLTQRQTNLPNNTKAYENQEISTCFL